MSDTTVDPTGRPSEPQLPGLPLLYRRPALLDAERHRSHSLKEGAGFGFARNATVLPVNVTEFAAAARHYPIVFAGEEAVPVAIVGVRRDANLFVDAAGNWAPGLYVPAYVRRYPFIFVESPDKTKLGLCIDEAADALVESDVRPLFRQGRPTEIVDQALNFCTAYQREYTVTHAFAQAVKENGLLIDNRADIRLRSGERLAVGGFKVIDEAKFNQLDEGVFLDWRRRGWLGPVYFHLMSALSWATLIDFAAGERRASDSRALG